MIPEDKQPELIKNITEGNVSMRVMKEMFESVLEMGPMSQVRGGGSGYSHAQTSRCRP